VREYSNDPVSLRNDGIFEGEYRAFPDAVAAAIRTAPLNQPIGPINTGRGYEVDIVMDRIPSDTIPFEKAKASIMEAEKAKYRKEKMNEKLGTVTNSKDVKIYTDAIAPLAVEVDREAIHKMHIDKARQAAEEKAKREQEDAAAQAAKGKGG
jgi:parvulin-like peptidyl-prolyl isomerase